MARLGAMPSLPRPGHASAMRTSGEGQAGPTSLRAGAPGRFTDGMFVSDELLLGTGFSATRQGFARLSCEGSLLAASEEAYGQGIRSLAEAGEPGLFRLAGVRFRDLAAGENSAALALRWEALGPDGGLFPALDANLTLTQSGEQASLLALAGTYRLPAAAPGTAIVNLAAAATIPAFLTRVATRIARPPANVA